ncbi:MAG: aspartate 1-decarboxylase [Deltaproteobacteria bacterium]|nr:aspartate 1-decarboxylase [Deltaproteobacteria bacterium]
MQRTMLKSKIHRATVTGACVDYEGSVTIDSRLLEAADILEYEQVQIYNVSNGERFATYVIHGEPDSGVICLNGAAARKVSVRDLVIICSYVNLDDAKCRNHRATNVFVDKDNKITRMH